MVKNKPMSTAHLAWMTVSSVMKLTFFVIE